jgi:AmmeMemoRadiSam system protein A
MQSLQAILISPHPPALIDEIGYGGLKDASSSLGGMMKLAYIAGQYRPKVIVYISPHGNMFHDAICVLDDSTLKGDLRKFGAPQVAFQKTVCQPLMDALRQEFNQSGVRHIFLGREDAKNFGVHIGLDHGVIVPMYFIDQQYKDYEIIHITPGVLPLRELYTAGKAAIRALESAGLPAIVVASGDLSHYLSEDGPYGFHEEGPLLDKEIVRIFREERLTELLTIDKKLIERGGECGLKGFAFAFGMADGIDTSVSVYSYEAPFGVGYMTAAIVPAGTKTPPIFAAEKKAVIDPYVALAQAAIEKYTKEGAQLNWDEYKRKCSGAFIREVEEQKSGAFVSIHKSGALRGCIGTISATRENLAEEIIYCAVEACSADPRFYPVTKTELDSLDVKVDILMPAEDIDDISLLDAKRYGVIVSKGARRGLLLPNLTGVDTVEEQLIIAKKKAGIAEKDMNVRLKRFEVIRHGQK